MSDITGWKCLADAEARIEELEAEVERLREACQFVVDDYDFRDIGCISTAESCRTALAARDAEKEAT
jgi:hypothetical protein